jgi:hypothetical protein
MPKPVSLPTCVILCRRSACSPAVIALESINAGTKYAKHHVSRKAGRAEYALLWRPAAGTAGSRPAEEKTQTRMFAFFTTYLATTTGSGLPHPL